MARTETRTNLRAQIRQRAFLEATTTVVTDSEINTYIDQSWAELHDILVEAVQDYSLSTTTFVTVAAQDTYALPADFYKFRKLLVTLGGNDTDLREFRLEELQAYQYQGGWFAGAPIAYHRVGSNVMFRPTPSTAGTVITMYYVKAPVRMTSDSDTVDGQAGWEEFIVLDSACKCLDKLDRDCSRIERQREQIRQRIVAMSASTNYGEPQRVVRRRSLVVPLRGWR